MKIAVIAPSEIPSIRANSIQVMKVSQAFRQNGHDIRLFVPGSRQVPWEDLERHYGIKNRFPIEWIPAWKPLRYIDFSLRILIKAKIWGAEVIYTRMTPVAMIASRLHFPVILELHSLPTGKRGPRVLRNFLRSPQQKMLVLITQALRRLLEQQMGEPLEDQQVVIAPDGVDIERYEDLPSSTEIRQQLGLPEKFTVLYSGSFYQGRGLELLFQLAKEFSDLQFLWVGGKAEEVVAWQTKLDAANVKNVILTGFVENARMPLYQAAADLLLMPYGRKIAVSGGGNTADFASPLKTFEYMASGRPIITSDLPVLHEVLNGSNAAFCPPDDLTAWKATIQALMQNPQRCEKMAQQAKLDARQYSWQLRMEKIIQQWRQDA